MLLMLILGQALRNLCNLCSPKQANKTKLHRADTMCYVDLELGIYVCAHHKACKEDIVRPNITTKVVKL